MNMTCKNFFKIVPFLLFVAFATPVKSIAAVKTTPLTDSAADARLYAHIVSRVAEIQSMDKTNLSTAEKKALKKELMKMKQQDEKLQSRGLYISLGAIIIILLLILIL